MISMFQKNTFSRVEQNGHFSSIIPLSLGCRQADPLSPYIFVTCVEVLAEVVSGGVKGIELMGCKIKLSHYAGDTTAFLNGGVSILKSWPGQVRELPVTWG